MILGLLRWLARNLSTLILAFILAVVVWVSAVVTADPNEEHTLGPINIERIGQAPDLLLVGNVPSQVTLTLRAPKSIWEQLNSDPDLVQAWIDLSGLESGQHEVDVKTNVNISPVRYILIDPAEIQLTLEPLLKVGYDVKLVVNVELPLGYRKGEAVVDPLEIIVSGPESAVQKVAEVRATLDISGSIETVRKIVSVTAVDANGNTVPNVSLSPKTVTVTQPITLLGGFKNVVVKVVTTGQVANGYRLTNITVSPPNVTLFSDNPQLLNEVPGFVETLPVDLTGLNDDIEISVGLNLLEGISLVRDPSVFVQVSVAAIEGSMTLTLPVEVIGLSPDLDAEISPATVDVIIAGPLNILETLSSASFRVVLDLTGLPPGIYQRTLEVDLLPDQVRVQTILPDSVEVIIVVAPTPTPTPTVSASPGSQPTPTITPTETQVP